MDILHSLARFEGNLPTEGTLIAAKVYAVTPDDMIQLNVIVPKNKETETVDELKTAVAGDGKKTIQFFVYTGNPGRDTDDSIMQVTQAYIPFSTKSIFVEALMMDAKTECPVRYTTDFEVESIAPVLKLPKTGADGCENIVINESIKMNLDVPSLKKAVDWIHAPHYYWTVRK
jgi:hypothetical protein